MTVDKIINNAQYLPNHPMYTIDELAKLKQTLDHLEELDPNAHWDICTALPESLDDALFLYDMWLDNLASESYNDPK